MNEITENSLDEQSNMTIPVPLDKEISTGEQVVGIDPTVPVPLDREISTDESVADIDVPLDRNIPTGEPVADVDVPLNRNIPTGESTGIVLAQLSQPVQKPISPAKERNLDSYGRNVVITPYWEGLWKTRKRVITDNETLEPHELINKALRMGMKQKDLEKRKRYELKILKHEQIPIFKSEEEALESGWLGHNDLYAVAPINAEEMVTVFSRKPRKHVTAIEAAQQASNDLYNAFERGVSIPFKRQQLAVIQQGIKGFSNVADLVPTLTVAAISEVQPINYAVKWYYSMFGTEEEQEDADRQVEEAGKQRLSAKGPFPMSTEEIYHEYKEWAQNLGEAFENSKLWDGVNGKEYFLGRVASLFTEEYAFGRILAAKRFVKGRRIFSKLDHRFKNLNLTNVEDVANSLGITQGKAKRLVELHRLGYSKELQFAFKIREADAALGFALGMTALTPVDADGNPTDKGFNAIALAGGFGGALLGPGQFSVNVLKKQRWTALGLMYSILDVTSRRTVGNTPEQILTRKRYYLRSRGLSNAEIDTIYNNGTLDDVTNQFLTSEETGDLRKLLRHIDGLPDDIKKELQEMASTSFDSLSEITIHAKEKMGIDVNIFVDTILGLTRIQQVKETLIAGGTGMFSPMWAKAIPLDLEQLTRNEIRLQQSLTDFVEDITKKMNKDDPARHLDEVSKQTNEFFNINVKIANHLINKAETSFAKLNIDVARENSRLNQLTTAARQSAFSSINPHYGVRENRTVRFKEQSNNKLLGEDGTGTRIDTEDNPSIKKVFFDERKRRWNAVDTTVEFKTKNFFEDLAYDFIDNPEELAEIFNLTTRGFKTPAMGRIINAVTRNNLRFLNTGDIPSLESMLNKAHGDDLDIAEKIKDALNDIDTPEGQLDFLKNEINNLSPTQKASFVPSTMTLEEIKNLHSYFSSKTVGSTNKKDVFNYKKHIESLDSILGSPNDVKNPKHTNEQVAKYLDNRELEILHSDVWRRGPFFPITTKNKRGEYTSTIEEWAELFISDEKRIVENAGIFEKLKKGAPIGFDKNGDVIYKELTKDQLTFLDNSIAETIALSVRDNKLSRKALDKIIDTYGKDGVGVLSESQIKKLIEYSDLRFEEMKIFIDESRIEVDSVSNNLSNLFKAKTDVINSSFVGKMKTLSQSGTSGDILDFLEKSVNLPNLTEEQIKQFFPLYKAEYLTPVNVDALIGKPVGATVVNGFDYLKMITNDFKGLTREQIKKTLPVGSSDDAINRAFKESADEATSMKESLNTILLNKIQEDIFEISQAKIVVNGKLEPQKLVNSAKFRETLERVAQIRKEVLEIEENSLLDTAYRASTALLAARGARGEVRDLYQSTLMSSAISRVYGWQRGVVGLRYLIGEAAVKQLRKDQSKAMLKVLTDKDAAQILVLRMQDKKLPEMISGKDLFSFKISPARAFRAVAYAVGMEIEQLKDMFSDEEMVAFYNSKEGEVPDTVIERIPELHRRKARREIYDIDLGISYFKTASNDSKIIKTREEMKKLMG